MPKRTADVECQLCKKLVDPNDMRHHIGAHLLEDDWTQWKRDRPAFPCGLCGINAAVGQHMVDPLSISECTVSINGVQARHQCKLVGGDIKYGLKKAGEVTVNGPCTNRPMKCPICSSTVWSYSMAAHFANRLSSHGAMSAELSAEVALQPHERHLTSQLIKNNKAKKFKCTDASCNCKFKD